MFPLDIRRLIWQKSLPGRRFISLGCSLCSAWPDERLRCGKKVHKCLPKPPILLRVNQESRRVTLENYTTVHKVRRCYHGTRPKNILRPLYIDPKVDLVSISMYSMFDRPEEFPSIFQQYSPYEQFFDKIHTLEIRDFKWCGPIEVWYKIFHQANGGFLKHFHELRALHLVEPGGKDWETYRSSWGLPRHKNTGIEILKKWFNENKGNHPPQVRRSVPEFFLHAFRRSGPRSDDEHRNLARLQLSLDDEDSG
jgi:2EXR family